MKHIEGTFAGVREMEIYYQGWLPEDEPKAVLMIVHGLGEHSGRYGNVVEHLVPQGYALYALDHIGHGKSEGDREIVETFADFPHTLKIYYQLVKDWQPGKPIFVLGHSLGGAITCFYLLDHPQDFAGAVISAPAIAIGEGITSITIAMSKLMSKIAPKMGVLALDSAFLSKDQEVVQAYDNDPLVFHGKTPARMGAELLSAMTRINTEVAKINLPFFVVQGSEDKLVEPAGAQVLHEKAGSIDKTYKVYQGLYHEVFNEPEREQVLKDVESWLEARL